MSQIPFPSEIEWIKILRDAVQHAPIVKDKHDNEIPCLRPNSFTYITDVFDISTPDNNTNDVNTISFFDRAIAIAGNKSNQQHLSYPAVKFRERTYQADSFFSSTDRDFVINGNLFVLNKHEAKKGSANYCETRNLERIFYDSNKIVFYIFTYIKELVWTEENGYITSKLAEHLGLNEKKIIGLQTALNRLNKDSLGRNVKEESAHGLAGVYYQINLPFRYCDTIPEMNAANYDVTKLGTCGL